MNQINLLGAPVELMGPIGGIYDNKFVKAAYYASIIASAYHGSKRHGGSVKWGLAWGGLGAVLGFIAPAIGYAQGFAKCKFDCR